MCCPLAGDAASLHRHWLAATGSMGTVNTAVWQIDDYSTFMLRLAALLVTSRLWLRVLLLRTPQLKLRILVLLLVVLTLLLQLVLTLLLLPLLLLRT